MPKPTTANDSVATFRKLADRYVEEMFERFPTYGAAVGRKEFNGELEIPSLKLYADHEKLIRSTLAGIQDLPENDFGGDDWLDRRALMSRGGGGCDKHHGQHCGLPGA